MTAMKKLLSLALFLIIGAVVIGIGILVGSNASWYFAWIFGTAFFVLLLAGAHLAFAFPLISKLLALFNLSNTLLLALTTSISFVLFALLYTLIYRITSNSYYKIVSDNSETAA